MTSGADRAPEGAWIEIERFYPTSPEKLYDFFTEPEHLKRWWGPRGTRCLEPELDLRPGGAYRLPIVNDEGGRHTPRGQFVEVNPKKRLVFTFVWEGETGELGQESLVSVEFLPADGGALLRLRHERLASDDAAANHRQGWTSSFDCLEDALAD